jgi:hypothetical protein
MLKEAVKLRVKIFLIAMISGRSCPAEIAEFRALHVIRSARVHALHRPAG